MHSVLEFLVEHGYVVLFCWVFAEQIGLPVPTIPLLLAMGALAGAGRLSVMAAALLSILAALCADFVWYWLGRTRGMKVLQFLCKISLEPDSCVRQTEGVFAKSGAWSLLFAKFVPGLGTVAPPLAGMIQMRLRRFILFDGAGATLWAGAFLSLGYLFSEQIELVATYAARLGRGLGVLLVSGLVLYLAYKVIVRRQFLRELRIARISVDELKRKIDAGEDLVIVDLRHSIDFEANPETIPGAVHLDVARLEERDRLPRDRDVVLYCT
jgi:membrane protein DedA with SNARE-associated domain